MAGKLIWSSIWKSSYIWCGWSWYPSIFHPNDFIEPSGHLIIPIVWLIEKSNKIIQKDTAVTCKRGQTLSSLDIFFQVIINPFMATSHCLRWYKVTFRSPSCRSLKLCRGSLDHPKKATKNCQVSKRPIHVPPRHGMLPLGKCQLRPEKILFRWVVQYIFKKKSWDYTVWMHSQKLT